MRKAKNKTKKIFNENEIKELFNMTVGIPVSQKILDEKEELYRYIGNLNLDENVASILISKISTYVHNAKFEAINLALRQQVVYVNERKSK